MLNNYLKNLTAYKILYLQNLYSKYDDTMGLRRKMYVCECNGREHEGLGMGWVEDYNSLYPFLKGSI